MPQAENLVVPNGAAVDKTFTLLNPSAGQNSLAEWALKEGPISSVFPRLTATARNSPTNGGGKVVQCKLRVPSSYTDTVTGLTKVGSAYEFNGTVSIPDDFPEDLKADARAFVVGILGTSLFEAMFKDGSPAT